MNLRIHVVGTERDVYVARSFLVKSGNIKFVDFSHGNEDCPSELYDIIAGPFLEWRPKVMPWGSFFTFCEGEIGIRTLYGTALRIYYAIKTDISEVDASIKVYKYLSERGLSHREAFVMNNALLLPDALSEELGSIIDYSEFQAIIVKTNAILGPTPDAIIHY